MRSKKFIIIFVHGSLSPPLIEELSGTNGLFQSALASAFFLYKLGGVLHMFSLPPIFHHLSIKIQTAKK